jgi:ubiquinone/menaquinone biosynthesis C-methylase UbiE
LRRPKSKQHMSRSAEAERIIELYAEWSGRTPASRYSVFELSNLLRVHELERKLLKSIARHGHQDLRRKTILEIGCGTGHWLRQFIQWGAAPANLAGVDLLQDRISLARELCPPAVNLECQDASRLRFPDGCFDLIWQATVFSSILDASTRTAVAAEMLRVLRPDRLILWYDFFVNSPRIPAVRGMRVKEIRKLFPGCRLERHRTTLAPPVGRVVVRLSPLLYSALAHLRVFCTHYLIAVRKN